jgi:hypothetical protein
LAEAADASWHSHNLAAATRACGKIGAMPTIEELLHRRTDLSTFVVHFTRDQGRDGSARDNLLNILLTRCIEARNVYGMAKQLAERFSEVADTQRAVCFTETPLEHAWMMNSEIDSRRIQFDGYGVAFTRTFARRRGANPVWYLDITQGHDWLTVPVRELLEEAERAATPPNATGPDPVRLAAAPILRLAPFLEQMGAPAGTRKEFWWEREWRHVGDLSFNAQDIVVVFAPEGEHEELAEEIGSNEHYQRFGMPALVDAHWGLERMIAALAGIWDTGPFPA